MVGTVIKSGEPITKAIANSSILFTKKKIIDHLNDNCKIMIDMKIELVSANYVSTQMKCRGDFIKSNSDNLENNFKLSGKEPMCFWGGNIVYSDKDVSARIKT